VKGHNYGICRKCGKTHIPNKSTLPVLTRFWSKVKTGNLEDCWEWIPKIKPGGYGHICFDGHRVGAHRFAYELLHGPIPEGLTIDHLCRNRICVNPAHMELVPNRINVLRGVGITAQEAKKTHCPQGHVYDLFNTYYSKDGERHCRECDRERHRESYKTFGRRRTLNGIASS
jgi:hypothetical protein